MPSIEQVGLALRADAHELEGKGYTIGAIYDCLKAFDARRSTFRKAVDYLHALVLNEPSLKPIVHSVRSRVKDPMHLAFKLSKWALTEQKPGRGGAKNETTEAHKVYEADLFDLDEGVTDLGGVRILLLHRAHWKDLHRSIVRGFPGVRYIRSKVWTRKGDDGKMYLEDGLFAEESIKPHVDDYSSLHYVLDVEVPRDDPKQQPEHVYVECQVRTVFEEGWAEIDHQLRYPSRTNAVVEQQLALLNKAAYVANEVAASLGALERLPRFIPWKLELALERSAQHVRCFSPTLTWAAQYGDLLSTNVMLAFGRKTYYITPEVQDRAWRIKRIFDGHARTLTHLRGKLEFRTVEASSEEGHLAPHYADLLLLEGAVLPIEENDGTGTRRVVYGERNAAILGAASTPAQTPSDQQDVLITDPMAVEWVQGLFQQIAKRSHELVSPQ